MPGACGWVEVSEWHQEVLQGAVEVSWSSHHFTGGEEEIRVQLSTLTQPERGLGARGSGLPAPPCRFSVLLLPFPLSSLSVGRAALAERNAPRVTTHLPVAPLESGKIKTSRTIPPALQTSL